MCYSFLHNDGSSGVLLSAKYLEATAISLCFKILLKYILTNITVEKHTPCKLTFVYTSYIRYGIRAAPKFGKHASLYSYHKKSAVVW